MYLTCWNKQVKMNVKLKILLKRYFEWESQYTFKNHNQHDDEFTLIKKGQLELLMFCSFNI